MRGVTHRWIEPKPRPPSHGSTDTGHALEPLVRRILEARAIADEDSARAFLDPRLTELHPPEAIADLDRAARRILDALHERQPIAIYGDYDTDGIAATAILFHTLRMIDPDAADARRISTYVPHRLDEGYGLNADALQKLAEQGARLIITVDCGITACAEAARAHALGLDLIITDHHLAPHDGALPDALALVHPHRPGPDGAPYPFPDLCGAGVAFKLAWRLAVLARGSDRLPDDQRDLLLDLLALAGLATITDVVPLLGENRVIARHGLRRVKHTRLPGLIALLEASGLAGQRVGSEEAGFVIGPRLNACGRMGHAGLAVELLTTATGDRATEIAEHLNLQNQRRQATERRILDQACEMAAAAGMTEPDRRAIILAHEEWHPGVVGIVCSRLVARFSRPTILMQRDADRCKGSGRSIDGFDLHAALTACAAHLETFGGHKMAAGLTIRADRLDLFIDAFTAHAALSITDEMLIPALRIDCEATLAELTPAAVDQIERLGPFGRANPPPAILLRAVRATHAEPLGAHARHLRLRVREDAPGGRELRLIAWRWGDRADTFRPGTTLDVVVRPKMNTWKGRTWVEPELKDARPTPTPVPRAQRLVADG